MNQFRDTLQNALDDMRIPYTPDQIDQCEAYYKLVVETNKHTNLTRITDAAGAATMHFADAAFLLSCLDLPLGCRMIDVGTGAGFPGMPLKIMRPDICLTLLDASGKKTEFIRISAEKLSINVTVLCARAEEAARTDLRERFDIAVSRAVAPLNMLLELCVPLIKKNGTLAVWKGESYRHEIDDARNAMHTLGCTLSGSTGVGRGALLLIDKQKPAPDIYPRRFSKIKNQPL